MKTLAASFAVCLAILAAGCEGAPSQAVTLCSPTLPLPPPSR